jgi:hypothetical protein
VGGAEVLSAEAFITFELVSGRFQHTWSESAF